MRMIYVGDKTIGLKATPLALLFYKQAFKSDLIGDLVKMQEWKKNPTKVDFLMILQIAWALAKAHEGVGKKFPDFQTWLSSLDGIDFSDEEMINTIFEEAEQGFFRGARRKQQQFNK